MNASINSETAPKLSQRFKKTQRVQAALLLKNAGMRVQDIATELGVDRKSVARYTKESEEVTAAVKTALQSLNTEIEALLPVQEKAKKYVALAISAKNEAVSLGALQRIDDLAGIVTEKELVRSKRNDPASPQALFALPPGTSISFSATTTSSNVVPDNGANNSVIDVTPRNSNKTIDAKE